jgi:hypothetical protein
VSDEVVFDVTRSTDNVLWTPMNVEFFTVLRLMNDEMNEVDEFWPETRLKSLHCVRFIFQFAVQLELCFNLETAQNIPLSMNEVSVLCWL